MYKVKSKGPKTEPCGTPHDVGNMSEKQLPILMACCLSVRYEVNQLRTVPDMPYHVDRRVMRILWSMVSKAADRSSRVTLERSCKIKMVHTVCRIKYCWSDTFGQIHRK